MSKYTSSTDFQHILSDDEYGKCPVSMSDKTSHFKTSQNLKPIRLGVGILILLSNLAGDSAAVLPKHLPNAEAIEKLWVPISHLQGFAKSYKILILCEIHP